MQLAEIRPLEIAEWCMYTTNDVDGHSCGLFSKSGENFVDVHVYASMRSVRRAQSIEMNYAPCATRNINSDTVN